MATIPQYVLEKNLTLQLSDAMREVSLDVRQVGPLRTLAEGTEQSWKCSDESGDLFSFTTCQVTANNALGLKAGTICLMVGPRARNDVSDAFQRFERTLAALGAQRMQ
ncbi:MAG: hypothetical protein U1F83_01000 [Verrucomicrobiota bacterium]